MLGCKASPLVIPCKAMSKPFKIFLVVALLAVAGLLAWKFLLPSSSETTASQPSQPAATDLEPFAEAVRTATRAAEQTQTAQTTEEWATVAVQWDNAMQFMMKVPEEHEQYAIAQNRIPIYQDNRDYAFTNAGLLEP